MISSSRVNVHPARLHPRPFSSVAVAGPLRLHVTHHDDNALVVGWLLLLLSMAIERLYRLCFLHRGAHACPTAADLVALLWLALSSATGFDTS
jgi:hypothetical protein